MALNSFMDNAFEKTEVVTFKCVLGKRNKYARFLGDLRTNSEEADFHDTDDITYFKEGVESLDNMDNIKQAIK